jgi:DNA-binding response OmpR family regulator
MKRVLLIEDDDDLRKILRLMLQKLGCEVLEARNGKEGLALFRDAGADVVLTDLIMPEKEGLETIRELKRNWPTLNILAMSGGGRSNARDNLKMAKYLGASVVLAKPFSSEELAKALDARPDTLRE